MGIPGSVRMVVPEQVPAGFPGSVTVELPKSVQNDRRGKLVHVMMTKPVIFHFHWKFKFNQNF